MYCSKTSASKTFGRLVYLVLQSSPQLTTHRGRPKRHGHLKRCFAGTAYVQAGDQPAEIWTLYYPYGWPRRIPSFGGHGRPRFGPSTTPIGGRAEFRHLGDMAGRDLARGAGASRCLRLGRRPAFDRKSGSYHPTTDCRKPRPSFLFICHALHNSTAGEKKLSLHL